MYCQLHRPVTSGSQVACALGHIGDRIYWIQKGFYLPDALGIVPPPYFPILHVGITALVLILLTKALVFDPLQELNVMTAIRRRTFISNGQIKIPSGTSVFLHRYSQLALRALFEVFVLTSAVSPPWKPTICIACTVY